jgi:CRISPR-associated protein Csb2
MLVIEMSFPTGRFHATPWGRHVNEAAAEWPPSPYRLLRAIFDAWKRKRHEWPEGRVEPLLRQIGSSFPRFRLPPASVSHTRSFLSENTMSVADRALVFDGFVVLSPQATVLVGWPEVTLDPPTAADLDELLQLINFFGRSESWVKARVLSGTTQVEWNCFPESEAPEGRTFDLTRVACPVPAHTYEAGPYRVEAVHGKGKGLKRDMEILSWMGALAWTTNDLVDSLRSAPPALQLLPYVRPARCFEMTPCRGLTARGPQVNGVLYSLESKALPRATATIEIAERTRAKLIGIYKRIVGEKGAISSKFTGKDRDGKPMTDHRHIYIMPFDRNRDGRLDHLLVYCSGAFDQSEVAALDRMDSLWQPDGKPRIACLLLRSGGPEDILDPCSVVTSATPFVPPRHYRKGRGDFTDWLAQQVRLECRYHRLPSPSQVRVLSKLPLAEGRQVRWLEFRRNRKGDDSKMGYGFELEFPQPVTAPFALGYGCHFGLGLFLPSQYSGIGGAS